MKPLSPQQRSDALLRRRIKFVVEKGAMARLFLAGGHAGLQSELFRRLKPRRLARLRSRRDYDAWLHRTVNRDCWKRYSRNGLGADRWAYFAKLINIVVYEIVTNRELFADSHWRRLRPFLHIPIDAKVVEHLSELAPAFSAPYQLKGMHSEEYWRIQGEVRKLARKWRIPPIWFEAAWSA